MGITASLCAWSLKQHGAPWSVPQVMQQIRPTIPPLKFTTRNVTLLWPPIPTTATGNTVDFIPLFNAPTGVNHLWDFGNGNLSIADTPTYTFPTGGVHTVCHTVTTSCSADTACQQVVLCSPPAASYTHSVDSIRYGLLYLMIPRVVPTGGILGTVRSRTT